MDPELTIKEAVEDAAVPRDDGRLTLACADAFRLAADLGVTLPDIARVCNRNNIKIVRCQLGCFK